MIIDKKIDKKVIVLIISLICVIIFGIAYNILHRNYSYLADAETCINQCYDVKITKNDAYVILDSGHSRILEIDENSYVNKLIIPDGYVDNIEVADDGTIWTAESMWDGMWVSDEYICFYTEDGTRNEFAHYEYNDNISSKHKIYGLIAKYGQIKYAICEKNMIRVIYCDGDTTTEKKIDYDNAFDAILDICISGGDIYVLDKSGEISKINTINGKDVQTIYKADISDKKEKRVPFKIAISENNEIYFVDIRNHSVQKVKSFDEGSETIVDDNDTPTISIYEKEGDTTCIISDPDSFSIISGGDIKTYSDIKYQFVYDSLKNIIKALKILFIISIIVFAISVFRVAILRLNNMRILIAITMILSICVSGLLIYMLLNKFTDTYKENIYNQLEISAYIVANRVSTEDIANINEPEDYNTTSYKRLSTVMSESYPLDVDFNKNLYCNILKINKEGEACAIAYLDGTIGTYYPLDSEEKEEVKIVYDTKKPLWNDAKEDISGTYLYVKVPVFDNNENVNGCVAVGLPLDVLTETIENIRRDILTSSIVILLLLFTLISEVSKILDNKAIYDKNKSLGEVSLPGHVLMLLIIFIFAAYNMSSTFLPIFIIRNLPNIDINKEFLASIPITINIFIIGVMSLFCSKLIRKYGLKKVLTLTAVFSITGNAIIFLSPTYEGIFMGLILDGIGVGIITNTCYVVITYLKDEVMKMQGFTIYNSSCLAGINIGMLLGSIIAVNCDYKYVFLFVIVVWMIVMAVASSLYDTLKPLLDDNQINNNIGTDNKISFVRFISDHKINLFFILMQNPAIVFNSFVYYFLPIYCDNHGYSATIVSILFIFYTEIAVLTGDRVLNFLREKLKDNTMYVGFFINIVAVLVYSLFENMTGLVIALCLLGYSAGFCKPALQNYFISLRSVKEYGEDSSMGIYNFTENIGESLGPIIFSQLMVFSPIFISIAPFSAIISAMGITHFIVNRKSRG